MADLTDVINEVWAELYPGAEAVVDPFALEMRVRNIAEDRNNCAFNARVLQKGYNELDAKVRELTREVDAWRLRFPNHQFCGEPEGFIAIRGVTK